MYPLKQHDPTSIPATSQTRYISFKSALNVRLPEEDTGDWHFEAFWFDHDGSPSPVSRSLAGDGEVVNSSLALGDKGVRDLSAVLKPTHNCDGVQVFVANHFRAIADIALKYLQDGQVPIVLDQRSINDFFDTEEEIDELRADYLIPLRKQLDGYGRKAFDQWIQSVQFS